MQKGILWLLFILALVAPAHAENQVLRAPNNLWIIGAGDTDPTGSIPEGALFWRTDVGALKRYSSGSWTYNLGYATGEQFLIPAGSATVPGLAFSGDTNTGIYRWGADQIAFTNAGVARAIWGYSGAAGVLTLIGDAYIAFGTTNTLRIRTGYIVGSETKALTESSATAVADIALATGAHTGGTFSYCVYATDATDFQNRCAQIQYSAVNKAGTVTCTLAPATVNETTDGNAGALSAGTLTYAVTCADTTESFSLSINAVSSLTQTVLQAESRFDAMTTAAITPQ